MSKVRVTADAAGMVIIPSKNNPEWAHIRVVQDRMIVDENGFARKKTLSALIIGLVEDLKCYGWKKDQEIEGRVMFKERLEPFNTKEPDRDYKKAGKTGIVCCQDGQPIYRKNFYGLANATDVCVEHTNGDNIKAAYARLKEEEGEKVGLENIADI